MTDFEIISIFMDILALLMSFGSLVIALLGYLDKRNNKRKSTTPLQSSKPSKGQDGWLLTLAAFAKCVCKHPRLAHCSRK